MDICKQVMDRIVEVSEAEDPTDPDTPVLRPLRVHAEQCETCRKELAELRAFFAMCRVAPSLLLTPEEEAQIDALVARGHEEFMAMVRAHIAATT